MSFGDIVYRFDPWQPMTFNHRQVFQLKKKMTGKVTVCVHLMQFSIYYLFSYKN